MTTPERIALFMSRLGLEGYGGASRAAELLGVKRAAVSLWLKGRREISQPVLLLMARLEAEASGTEQSPVSAPSPIQPPEPPSPE